MKFKAIQFTDIANDLETREFWDGFYHLSEISENQEKDCPTPFSSPWIWHPEIELAGNNFFEMGKNFALSSQEEISDILKEDEREETRYFDTREGKA